MTNAQPQHPNATLTPRQRHKTVLLVINDGWTIETTADRFQAEGDNGLFDRSSQPKTSPNATPPECRRRIVELRKQRRWGASHIGHEVGRASSTVQTILISERLRRLDSGDRATAEPIRRYQRDHAWWAGPRRRQEARLHPPDGGGWRIHGRGHAPPAKRASTGYRFLHTALDDCTRINYSEIHSNEQAITAVGFWNRANEFFNQLGITVERVITDNGSCYRSNLWRSTLEDLGTTPKFTRPYRPQTNGKVEQYHRILLEKWPYIRDWHTDRERSDHYKHYEHFYNHHRAHGALGWSTPIATLKDNVSSHHT
jgi:transposase InsO family protein